MIAISGPPRPAFRRARPGHMHACTGGSFSAAGAPALAIELGRRVAVCAHGGWGVRTARDRASYAAFTSVRSLVLR